MEGLILGGLFFAALAVLVPIVLILALIVIVALRGDAEDSAGRARTLYLAGTSAAAIVTIAVAVTALTASIAALPGNNDERSDGDWFNDAPNSGESFFPEDEDAFGDEEELFDVAERGGKDDVAVRGIIASLIAALVALAVLRFHWPLLERGRRDARPGAAVERVHAAYCYVLCFAAVLTLLTTVSVAIYAIAELVAPDTMDAGDRGDVIEGVVPVLTLTLAAAAVFRIHWARVNPTTTTVADVDVE